MKKVSIIARKEMRELLKTKSILIFNFGYTLFFSVIAALGVRKSPESRILDTALFYMPIVIGILIAYTSTGPIFFLEKRDKIIETLLCTPVSLKRLWLGKVLGAAVPSYLVSLLSGVLIILFSNIFSTSLVFPSLVVIPHLLISVPLFITAIVSLIGFAYLLLGMREIRIVAFIIIAGVLGGFYGGSRLIGIGFTLSWALDGFLIIASLLLVALTAYLTRYLNKERIVTTIS